LRSTAAIVHLRWATPGLGRNLADTHPFTAGAYVMAHNGAIGPVDRLDALLVTEAIERPQGTTDSEHLLYGVTASLADNDNDLVAALESTSARGADAGLRAASLNSMFLGPDGLHVVNWHDPSGVPEAAARSNADDPSNPPYFDLRHRGTRGLDVVVSSGFVPDASSWTLLAPASVTHISAPGHSATRRLQPELSMCPLEPHVAQNSRQAVPGSIR
jgi:predicted glutamine amidotransferase